MPPTFWKSYGIHEKTNVNEQTPGHVKNACGNLHALLSAACHLGAALRRKRGIPIPEHLRCQRCTFQRRRRRLHVELGIWRDMPAYMQPRLHCLWHVKLHHGDVDASELQPQPVRCQRCTFQRRRRRLHIEPGIWRDVPAYMQPRLHCLWHVKLFAWLTVGSNVFGHSGSGIWQL